MINLLLSVLVSALTLMIVLSECSAPGAAESDPLRLTVVYNNEPLDDRLETAWGFACLIEGLEKTILFDTGGDGEILLSNMEHLGLDPGAIDVVALSHFHGDHTGGLQSIIAKNPKITVYMPQSFPKSFQVSVKNQCADLKLVSTPTRLFEAVHSTGEMGTSIIEQSLILDTSNGLVVITGCAHPGVGGIVEKAKQIRSKLVGKKVYLVLGGFHLNRMSEAEIREAIGKFKELGVKKVGPTHCTGDQAIALFRQAWGDNYVESGCGAVIELRR